MIRSILFSTALAFTITSNAQDFTYSNIVAQTATFSGGDLNIRKDDGSGNYAAGIPHYDVAASEQEPVAYVSGMTPEIEVDFKFTCADAPDSVTVMGVAPDGMEFPAIKVLVTSLGGGEYSFSYPNTAADAAFTAAESRFFAPFSIGWDVSFDDGVNWKNADSTKNTMYVTHNTPMSETGDFKYWRTVYDIACRNTDGLDTETDVIAGIWTDFTDQEMLTWDGDSLKYYNPMYSFNVTLSSLLQFRNAQCYTYSKLFLSTIKIQGIVRTSNYVNITPIGNTVCSNTVNRFLVKNWSFGTPTAGGECADFPYKNTYTSLLPFPYTSYNFITEEVSDEDGLAGQGSANPSSYFNNHQIALIDGVYYDPSYGVTYPSIAAIPAASFDGWGYRYTVGSVKHCLFTTDLTQSSLSSSVSTY